jgi:hypothetical protein
MCHFPFTFQLPKLGPSAFALESTYPAMRHGPDSFVGSQGTFWAGTLQPLAFCDQKVDR